MTINKNLMIIVTALMSVQLSLGQQKASQQASQGINTFVHLVNMQGRSRIDPAEGTVVTIVEESHEKTKQDHLNAQTAPHMREEDRVLLSQKTIMQDIHQAAKTGNIEKLNLLLLPGVMVDIPTEKGGYTALHCAARSGGEDAVKLLLQKGASVTKKSTTGCTALHFAAKNFQTATVKLLLTYDCPCDSAVNDDMIDVDAIDNNGNNALFWAALSLDAATIKVLLDAGATLLDNKNGQTPLDVAREVYAKLPDLQPDKSKLPEGWNPLEAIALLEAEAEREEKRAHAEI